MDAKRSIDEKNKKKDAPRENCGILTKNDNDVDDQEKLKLKVN